MDNSIRRSLFGIGSLLLLLLTTEAHAVPISYTYTGSWTSFSSAPFGATYVATVIMNNGGNTVANQLFTQADFVSANLVSGAYNETALPGDIFGWNIDFTSDGLGQLTGGYFDALLPNGDQWHFDNASQDEGFFTLLTGSAGFFSPHFSNPGRVVPEPATLGMVAIGLLLGCFASRQRRCD
jgi:hypothetical protein